MSNEILTHFHNSLSYHQENLFWETVDSLPIGYLKFKVKKFCFVIHGFLASYVCVLQS